MSAGARQRKGRRTDIGAIVERLVLALATGDRAGVLAELRPDVTIVIDSGGRGRVAPGAAEGGDAVSAVLLDLVTPTTGISAAAINGSPGFVLSDGDRVVTAVALSARAGLLTNVWVVCNPEKLQRWVR